MRCRLCRSVRLVSVVDLGSAPSSERYLSADELDRPEPSYPLHVRVCEACLLVQIPALHPPHDDVIPTAVTTPEDDVVVPNDAYARVADLVGFNRSLRALLSDGRRVGIEVAHSLKLFELGLFDSFCHNRFQYFTLTSMIRALATADLAVEDVELVDAGGDSIRVWARPTPLAAQPSSRVTAVLRLEQRAGLHDVVGYSKLRRRAESVRHALLRFLLDCRVEGRRVVGYGATGNGATLLNYVGIRNDLLEYTVDGDVDKHGRFTPGSRIPIYEPEQLAKDRPDVVLAFPWRREAELARELAYVAEWGGELVLALPTLHSASLSLESSRG